MKKCSHCKEEKELSLFSNCKSNKDGKERQCKACVNARCKKYFQNNKEIIKERTSDYQKDYLKKYYQANKDKLILNNKINYEKNKPNVMKRAKVYVRERRAKDLDYKMLCVLRSRLSNTVLRECKSIKTKELLGCSIEEFKSYIAGKFKGGMSWDNYGKFGWHLDHIIPCSKFDLKNIEDQKQCFHYTNLQPLWAKDNHSKSDKILNPIQTHLLV